MNHDGTRVESPPTARRQLVAVVDDDHRVLESLDDLLQSSGYATLLSPSAEAFLESPDRADVIALISDIGLPGMTGVDLVRAVRRTSHRLPIIMITGRTETHLEQDAMRLGVLRVYRKPFDANSLLREVAQLVADSPL